MQPFLGVAEIMVMVEMKMMGMVMILIPMEVMGIRATMVVEEDTTPMDLGMTEESETEPEMEQEMVDQVNHMFK